VKKGQALFQFDRLPYEPKVRQLEAEIRAAEAGVLTHRYMVATSAHKVTQLRSSLVAATYDVRILGQDVQAVNEKVSKVESELEYAKLQQQRYQSLAQQNAGPVEDAQKWLAQTQADEAGLKEALADVQRSLLRYGSQVDGINTIVVNAAARLKEGESSLQEEQSSLQEAIAKVSGLKAQLALARYYLDQTTMVAPENGRIVNLVQAWWLASSASAVSPHLFAMTTATCWPPIFKSTSSTLRPGRPSRLHWTYIRGKFSRGEWMRSGGPTVKGSTCPATSFPPLSRQTRSCRKDSLP
jgi:hypothetical protein